MVVVTKFQEWMLRHMFRRLVVQGGHRQNIIKIYSILKDAVNDEFTEDSYTGRQSFCEECHAEAWK